jgi:AcrR family transcriptional regulator
MRYPAGHKTETRAKLLASSRAIAKQGGFEATGVDALMAAVGLSGGAFYSHFNSKQALFEALVEEELANSRSLLAGDPRTPPEQVAKHLRGYLSSAHALNPQQGCALPSLGAEIARASPELRAKVEQQLKALQAGWRERLGDGDAAWALLAQCVGALMLARVVHGEKTRKDILAAGRRQVDKIQQDAHAAPPSRRTPA